MSESGFAELERAAQAMHATATTEEAVAAVLDAVVETMPAFAHVGLSLTRQGEPTQTTASTSDLVSRLDEVQYALEEGPCWDTLQGADFVSAPRLRHDQRWPRYVRPAVDQGVRAQVAVRLYLDEDGTIGGLNLYSTSSEEVTASDQVLARLFATHAALALGKRRVVDQLSEALVHRQTIGQAIGMLAERYGMTTDTAHAFLWRTSSLQNRKVRELAAELVRSSDEAAQASVDAQREKLGLAAARRRAESADAASEEVPPAV